MNDVISRQAAIDSLHMHLMYRMGTDNNKKRLDEWINNLPSAEPERKKGKWVDLKCDQCGQVDMSKPNYCPNCGADMREVEE